MADAKYTARTTRTKTTTEITIEREEFVALRRVYTKRRWCHHCAANTSQLAAEEAAADLSVSVNTIFAWCELGRLHFANVASGFPLVCLGSLRTSD